MNRQSMLRSLAVAAVICLSVLAVLVPGAPASNDPGDCRLPAWTHVLTGHWGGGCR
jgi:hypothetical protein